MSDWGGSAGKYMSYIWSKTLALGVNMVSFGIFVGFGDSGENSWWGTGMHGFITLLFCLLVLLLSGMISYTQVGDDGWVEVSSICWCDL